jgi:membrane protein
MTTAGQPKTKLKQVIEHLIKAVKEFNKGDGLYYAASLAFQVFFSLFPFIFFILALLGSLNIPGFFDWLTSQVQAVLPEQPGAGAIEQSIEQVRSQAQSGLLSFSWLIVTLWSASYGVRTTMHALNVAYDVQERPAWKEYTLSILYAILLAVLMIVALGLILISSQMAEWLAQQIGIGSAFATLWRWLRIPAAALLLMAILALIYYLFPNVDQPFRIITIGTVVAVIVWLGASLGFSFYVNNLASYSTLYGNLTAIIVLQLYIYISASIILFGAEVNEQIYREFAEEGQNRGEEQ